MALNYCNFQDQNEARVSEVLRAQSGCNLDKSLICSSKVGDKFH